jgi:hypothetical protein
VFGFLVAGLAVAALISVAIFTGAMPSPLARDFTTAQPDQGPATPPPPCPPAGMLPVAYEKVRVTVLNGTDRAGLATDAAIALSSRGFTILRAGNSAVTTGGVARIGFGPTGIGAAYTLAAHIDGARLALDTRKDSGVVLTVGTSYQALVDPKAVKLDATAPLKGPKNCVPLSQAKVAPPLTAKAAPKG